MHGRGHGQMGRWACAHGHMGMRLWAYGHGHMGIRAWAHAHRPPADPLRVPVADDQEFVAILSGSHPELQADRDGQLRQWLQRVAPEASAE